MGGVLAAGRAARDPKHPSPSPARSTDDGAATKLSPFYIIHYTYGMDYTLEGVFTPGEKRQLWRRPGGGVQLCV